MHALGARAQLTERLGTAQHQLAKNGELAAAQVQLFRQRCPYLGTRLPAPVIFSSNPLSRSV